MDEKPEKKGKRVLKRLRHKYRLIIINDETFEEYFSLKLSQLNIISWVGSFTLLVAVVVAAFLAFTPLRTYIPGYSDVETRKNARYAVFKTDSLMEEIIRRDVYLENLRLVISGEISGDSVKDVPLEELRTDPTRDIRIPEDSAMRTTIEEQEKYAILNTDGGFDEIVHFFFNPVSGEVTSTFDSEVGHYGVDVVTMENEPIKAAMDGTIVMADYTTNSGYVMQIQHANNLVTIYKHCSALLKHPGEKVSAGEPIAIVGNTGELSTGPHLHFEIWLDGVPIDPQKHIVF